MIKLEDNPHETICPVDTWELEEYFGTISRSMFTLFQVITCDDWSSHIARPLLQVAPGMAIFFIAFILLGFFGIANVILGVVCENCIQLAKENESKVSARLAADQVKLFNGLKLAFRSAGGELEERRESSPSADFVRSSKLGRGSKSPPTSPGPPGSPGS